MLQGSGLDPLSFSAFINDIKNFIKSVFGTTIKLLIVLRCVAAIKQCRFMHYAISMEVIRRTLSLNHHDNSETN